MGWWHMKITWQSYFLAVPLLDITLCVFVFLITWRIARRFGLCGLTVVLIAAAVLVGSAA